jgi:hypothetical protein
MGRVVVVLVPKAVLVPTRMVAAGNGARSGADWAMAERGCLAVRDWIFLMEMVTALGRSVVRVLALVTISPGIPVLVRVTVMLLATGREARSDAF